MFRFTADNDLNSRLKSAQQEANVVASNAQADSPATQEEIDQNIECDSNDNQIEADPPVAASSQEPVASTTSEVSSSYDQPVSTTSGVSSSVHYSDSDSDDGDDCPVFEYSAESMQVAKDSNDSPESTSKAADQIPTDENMENDEDLVQLDDDEHFANETGISDEQVNQTQADNSQTIESPIASPETTTNTGTECSENAAMNYACESNEPPPNSSQCLDNETEDVSETEGEAEAENTEAQPSTTNAPDSADSVSNEKNTTPKAGIDGIEGMDTEMISEDEMVHDDNQNSAKEHHKADKEENNNRKSERDESFKKVSKNNKERNYRDKKEKNDVKSKRKRSRSRGNRRTRSRSSRRSSSSSSARSRSRSRSRSRNRNNRRTDKRSQRKDREKRQEIQRYDVRTLIADRPPRNYKDKYGRDNSRQRSLSPRRVVRSKSKSYSRSISPGKLPSSLSLS